MKKLALAAALVAGGSLGLQNTSFAHGGTYRGPGDTVPPGGGGAGGGGASAPGPSGPSSPGPGGAGTPGPAAPGAPGGGSSPQTGGGGPSGPDLTAWTFWWEFNKEPYLNLRSHIHSGGTKTGSDGWFLGKGEKNQSKDTLRPTEQQIRQKVVPALIRAAETESNNDIVTGSLIALAKIGDAKSEDGTSRFEQVISKRLSDSVQEIRETAAVALGILANDSSVATLEALLNDTDEGRKLVKSTEVNYRTRSFAAYGLALIGARTGSEEVRQEIVRILAGTIETEDTKSLDLRVACLVAMGLVPLERIEHPPVPEGEDAGDYVYPPESCRLAQLDYLMKYLQDEENRFLARAHAPTAMVRLVEGLPAETYDLYKKKIADDLIARVDSRSKEQREVMQSAVLSLGMIGDLDGDDVDQEIRDVLASIRKDQSDQQSRNFSMIALGKVGGNIGNGDYTDGIKQVSKAITGALSDGASTLRPWAGLAVGVMGRQLSDNNVNSDVATGNILALRETLKDEKNTERVGAYAISAGILADLEAESILLEKLDRLSDDTARGYVAVALGLMNARSAIEPIQSIVKDSKYRPELLKQAAISLGLLGDKDLVPDLIEMLSESKGLATQAALSTALGFIGDHRSIDPLVDMLGNSELTARARGFAAVALGIVAEKEPLPWNTKIAVDLNYRASTTTLNEQGGTGILNIL